jgi:hypothetical protein
MYYAQLCRTVIFFTCFYCLSFAGQAAVRISLKKALASKLVTVVATSTGGYSEKSLKLGITNNSKSDLNIDIDPGLIFTPEDTSYQHLVVLGNETLAIGPSATKNVALTAFCGKSYARGPMPNLPYRFWLQGDSNMIRTLIYAKTNSVDRSLIQRAVWVFTNGYCLNSIYTSAFPRMSEDFAKYVASLRKARLPEYFSEYQLESRMGQPVLVAENAKVFVNMHWGHEGYRHMYLTIYKENGDIYKKIEADQIIDKYGFTVLVEFDTKRDPKGTYTVQLRDDDHKIWDQKKVIIGMRACDMM